MNRQVRAALLEKPHGHGSPLVVEKDAYGNRVSVVIERGSRWEREPAGRVQNNYFTCWVYEDASYVYRMGPDGRARPEHLSWAKDLIAQALGIDPDVVRLGFGPDEFDVRPY